MKAASAAAVAAGMALLATTPALSQAASSDWAYISAFPGALAVMFEPVVGIHIRKRAQGGFDVELVASAYQGSLAKPRHAGTSTDECPGLNAQLAEIPVLAASGQEPPPGPPASDSGVFRLVYLADTRHPVSVCCGGAPVGVWGDRFLRVIKPCWRDVEADAVKDR